MGALVGLQHVEIIVEVNGIEGTSSAQVQARWSFVLEEIKAMGDSADVCAGTQHETLNTGLFESPSVEIIRGCAHVQRSAVVSWKNKNQTSRPGQLQRALDFLLPPEKGLLSDRGFRTPT